MGGPSRRKYKKSKTFNFREWDVNKPIPFLGRGAMTRKLSESVVPTKAPGPGGNPLRPFLKHLMKTERKERHLVSTIATNVPIPIPGVELVPLEEYNKLYPKVYDKQPPLIQDNDLREPEVESLSDVEYALLYPPVFDEMPASRIETPREPQWPPFKVEELYRPDLRSLPEPEVECVKEEYYNKLYPPVYDEMPSFPVEDLYDKLVRKHIESGKRNPIVLLKRVEVLNPSAFPGGNIVEVLRSP